MCILLFNFFNILQSNRWCNQFLTRHDSQFAEKGNDTPQK